MISGRLTVSDSDVCDLIYCCAFVTAYWVTLASCIFVCSQPWLIRMYTVSSCNCISNKTYYAYSGEI